ncbi:hypothetical protein GALL_379250 [mine drainage metagenome]|uniref:Uncharacterized protein n=1 Tax=mine drainage metagenome TaxID=410659 RepID=A0A1J5QK64_9ZZZZ
MMDIFWCHGNHRPDPGAIAQLVGAVDDHFVADRQAMGDDNILAFRHTRADGAHLDGFIVFQHIHIAAMAAALHGRCRDGNGILLHIDQHADIDELIGEQGVLVIPEFGAQPDGPGRGVDLVVQSQQRPFRQPDPVLAVECHDRQRAALFHPSDHHRQAVLRDREQHRDRLHLGNRHDACGIGGMNLISRIHQAQADNPVERRRDAAIAQLQPGVVHLRLIHGNRRTGLAQQGLLRIHLLPGNGILRQQRGIAIQIHLDVVQSGFVLGELGRHLRQLGFVRPRIDFRQQVARSDGLTLAKIDLHELAVDAGLDGDGIARRDRADRLQVDIDISCRGHGRQHRHRARLGIGGSLHRRHLPALVPDHQCRPGRQRDHHDQQQPAPELSGRLAVRMGRRQRKVAPAQAHGAGLPIALITLSVRSTRLLP